MKGTWSRVLAGLLNKNILSAVKFINLQGDKSPLVAYGYSWDPCRLAAQIFVAFLGNPVIDGVANGPHSLIAIT